MKRFHVDLSVHNLPQSIRFYSNLFGTEPSVAKADYAKWMIEENENRIPIASVASQQIKDAEACCVPTRPGQ
jgi:predicted enzyme related to lactoylglutathione lyase